MKRGKDMSYIHYVITRFNIKQSFGCKPRKPEENFMQKNLDEKYLSNRFTIFENYTLPSLQNQTNKNFKWLLLFHKNTPEKFKQMLYKWEQIMPQIQPVFLEEDEKWNITTYRKKNNQEQEDFYITSRIDNDDAYHKEYIEKIQNYVQANPVSPCILTFPKGMQYSVETKKLYQYPYEANHFTTMLSKEDSLYTQIYQLNHSKIFEHQEEINIHVLKEEKPMWLEIVHETNFINHIKPQLEEVFIEKQQKYMLDNFGVKEDLS